MELSTEYITELSLKTNIDRDVVISRQAEMLKSVHEVLRAAATDGNNASVKKKTLKAILADKSFRFV